MPITVHLCRFQFRDVDFRRVGQITDGGTSLSGISEQIEVDGGGYWRLDATNGSTRTRETGLAWRALSDILDGGATAVDVLVCDLFFAPVAGHPLTPHSDATPFSDKSLYVSSGASFTAAAAPLRATRLTISGVAELPLIGGEVFSIRHVFWGNRTYRIIGIEGDVVTIRPPLREAIDAGTELNFDTPRCQMHLAPGFQVSLTTNIGRYGSCALSLVEDMRKPA
ncbi:MAG: hypothetical protein PGN16_04160 [Sphingomonas phyllosphaerae]|uniref:hypothetical protein n=1 Tax=Sphingomonas phyllosphaerae TaxID=257003 RepID=UPI002FF48B28